MRLAWNYLVIAFSLAALSPACDDSQRNGTESNPKTQETKSEPTTPEHASTSDKDAPTVGSSGMPDEADPPKRRGPAPQLNTNHEETGDNEGPTKNVLESSDKDKSSSIKKREHAQGTQATDRKERIKEHSRVIRALADKYDSEDLRRAEDEIRQEMKRRQAADKSGKQVGRPMGALVDEHDPESDATEESK